MALCDLQWPFKLYIKKFCLYYISIYKKKIEDQTLDKKVKNFILSKSYQNRLIDEVAKIPFIKYSDIPTSTFKKKRCNILLQTKHGLN